MFLFRIGFAAGVAFMAYRGVTGTTAVNVVVNIVQITALLVFSVIAIAYRAQHPDGSKGYQLVNGLPVDYVIAQEQVMEGGKPKLDPPCPPLLQNTLDGHNP